MKDDEKGKIVTIEQTSKPLKAKYAVAFCVTALGAILGALGYASVRDATGDGVLPKIVCAFGIVLFAVGFIWLLCVDFLMWWKHG